MCRQAVGSSGFISALEFAFKMRGRSELFLSYIRFQNAIDVAEMIKMLHRQYEYVHEGKGFDRASIKNSRIRLVNLSPPFRRATFIAASSPHFPLLPQPSPFPSFRSFSLVICFLEENLLQQVVEGTGCRFYSKDPTRTTPSALLRALSLHIIRH